MSRNRDQSITLLFELIQVQFDLLEPLPSDFFDDRYLTLDTNEKDWLSYCKVLSKLEVAKEQYYAIVKYDSELYFIVINNRDNIHLPSGLEFYDLNLGLFTVIITELEIPVKTGITNLYLTDKVLSQSKNNPDYTGHNSEYLYEIFPKITVCKFANQFIGNSENLLQIVCLFLSTNKHFLTLPFSTRTLESISEVILVGSQILNYDNIIQSLLSSNFKFSFLDFYRCIEMLYQIVYIEDAYQHLTLSINKRNFLNTIDQKLRWRPTERAALKKIFNETQDAYKDAIVKAIKSINNTNLNYSDWIYDLRCNIVHLKSEQVSYNFRSDQWDSLIYGLSRIILFWYQRYITFE